MTENETTVSFEVYDFNREAFDKLFNKYNRKAVKLGLTPLAIVGAVEGFTEVKNKKGKVTHTLRYETLTIDGAMPVLNGYKLLAALDVSQENVIVHNAPGATLPVEHRHTDNTCEHCNMKRSRKDIFVLETPEGDTIRVGRNCLADYVRDANAEAAFRHLAQFWEAGPGTGKPKLNNTPREAWYIPVKDVLFYSALAIRVEGAYVKASYYRDEPGTAGLVRDLMFPPKGDYGKWIAEYKAKNASDVDTETAEAVLNWLRNEIPADVPNEYLYSIKSCAMNDMAPYRTFNRLVSSVATFLKAETRRKEREDKNAAVRNSTHVGKVGDKLVIENATVRSVRNYNSNWGYVTQLIFNDAEGNAYGWYASKALDVKEGDTITVRGSIKKHDEFNGIKQTWLTRAKLVG